MGLYLARMLTIARAMDTSTVTARTTSDRFCFRFQSESFCRSDFKVRISPWRSATTAPSARRLGDVDVLPDERGCSGGVVVLDLPGQHGQLAGHVVEASEHFTERGFVGHVPGSHRDQAAPGAEGVCVMRAAAWWIRCYASPVVRWSRTIVGQGPLRSQVAAAPPSLYFRSAVVCHVMGA